MTTLILSLLLSISPTPLLCEAHPWLCVPCGAPGLGICESQLAPEPQPGEWLCCGASGICVIAMPEDCDTGLYGWCDNVVVETLRNGVEVATCEDPQ